MKEIPELNDEELKELKKLNKFYGIGLKEPLEKRLVNDICNYYAKESKTDFSNNDLKLYWLLTEKEEKTFPELSEKISCYFVDIMKEKSNWKATKNQKIAANLWDEDKKKINECEYLVETDKKMLTEGCDKFSKMWVEGHRKKKKRINIYGILSLIGLILSPFAIKSLINIKGLFEWFDKMDIGISGLLILAFLAILPIATICCIADWNSERKKYKELRKNE